MAIFKIYQNNGLNIEFDAIAFDLNELWKLKTINIDT